MKTIIIDNKILIEAKPGVNAHLAFRAFDEEGRVDFYTSTRLGGIQTTDTVEVEVSDPASLVGKAYELKDITTRTVVAAGIITETGEEI